MQAQPMDEETVIVLPEEAAGKRIDRALADQLPDYSRTVIAGWIDAGRVLVNGQAVPRRTKVEGGEEVVIRIPPPKAATVEAEDIPLSILFEDEHLIAIDKPAGLTVHPGSGQPDGTLANALVHHFRSLPEALGSDRPGIVHRLDKDTSGVIVVAKSDLVQRRLSEAFAARTVKKTYLAVRPRQPRRRRRAGSSCRSAVISATARRWRSASQGGRDARTDWHVERRLPRHTLIRCSPHTGRTHQIRVHLKAISGTRSSADPIYGNRGLPGRGPGAGADAPRLADRLRPSGDPGGGVVRGAPAARVAGGAGARWLRCRPSGAGEAGSSRTPAAPLQVGPGRVDWGPPEGAGHGRARPPGQDHPPLEGHDLGARPSRSGPSERPPSVRPRASSSNPPTGPPPRPEDFAERIGGAGEPPFTRGVQPTMYRGRLWTMRQYAGFATAEETNQRYRKLLEEGQTGLSVAFDLPTQIGYDPDDALAAGEVGRVGVSIAHLDDMETLLDGIPLEKVSISMTINSTAIVLLSLLVAVAKRRGEDPAKLRGTLQNDMFKEFIARGTQRLPVRPSLRLVVDVIEYATRNMPKWNPISISGYHIREAGATAVEEVALTLADAIGYVEAARDRGLDVDAFARRLSFFFNAHNNLFEEVAKFRAARRMWERIMRERFEAKDARSRTLRFHTQTAGSTLQAKQIDVNVVRVTLQALAAVLGGTQSLHTNSRDEALSLPSEAAAVLALRTQQTIAYESGVADVIDPLGGSPFVEALTDEVEAKALALIGEIDERGGTLAAIEDGFPQRVIEQSAYEAQKRIDAGEDVVVGVNRFDDGSEPTVPEFTLDPRAEARAVERIRAAPRPSGTAAAVDAALASLRDATTTEENLVPYVLAAVEARATIGEVMAVMEDRWGTFRSPR